MIANQKPVTEFASPSDSTNESQTLRNLPSVPKKDDFLKLTARRFTHPAPQGKTSLASAWNEALCCEARNSLQVVLSGAEILMEDHLGNLQPAQKALLAKMMDNAYHLCNLMATLAGPDEFSSEQIAEDDVLQLPRPQKSAL